MITITNCITGVQVRGTGVGLLPGCLDEGVVATGNGPGASPYGKKRMQRGRRDHTLFLLMFHPPKPALPGAFVRVTFTLTSPKLGHQTPHPTSRTTRTGDMGPRQLRQLTWGLTDYRLKVLTISATRRAVEDIFVF